MVKPGVYNVDKKNVTLKQGQATVEYVEVNVKPNPNASVKNKGCTFSRLLGVVLVILALVVIAIGLAYAIKWEDDSSQPHMPEGGDVIYPSPGDHNEDHGEHHGGHHGDHPGNHDGHHGEHTGDHDSHNDHHGRPPTGEYGDGRLRTTERPPPLDYIGTRKPKYSVLPTRRPPRTRSQGSSTLNPQHPAQPTRRPHRTRLPYHPPRTQSPHHPPPHHPPHHHRPPHHHTEFPINEASPSLIGRKDGHDNDHTSSDWPGYISREYDREHYDHYADRFSYKGISAWKADMAIKQRKIKERMHGYAPLYNAQEPGRSRIEQEEELDRDDYGHSKKQPRNSG